MRKITAISLILIQILLLTCCGAKASGGAEASSNVKTVVRSEADSYPDTVTSSDGKYEIAYVTDAANLKDRSFNQGSYDGCKLYAARNGLTYKYYQPAGGGSCTDNDRYDAMKMAVSNGAKIVVCAGELQTQALMRAAKDFPEVCFIQLDGEPLGYQNIAPIKFREEQCGYFAGYAIVREGFDHLGFCGGGGGTNAPCSRYGYGFVQGAEAAAREMGKKVSMNYSWLYGATFSASPELLSMCDGWYANGTQVIFACGGRMFNSVTAAASANDAYVVGVDTDQSLDSDTVITSAIKDIASATQWAIGMYYDGKWDEIGDRENKLGAAEGATGLPTETWKMKNFTIEEYEKMKERVISGELMIDDDFSNLSGSEVLELSIIN